MLFKFVKFNMSAEMFIKLQKAVYILMAVYAAVYGVVLLLSNSPKYNLDGRKVCCRIHQIVAQSNVPSAKICSRRSMAFRADGTGKPR